VFFTNKFSEGETLSVDSGERGAWNEKVLRTTVLATLGTTYAVLIAIVVGLLRNTHIGLQKNPN